MNRVWLGLFSYIPSRDGTKTKKGRELSHRVVNVKRRATNSVTQLPSPFSFLILSISWDSWDWAVISLAVQLPNCLPYWN
jgi:hypothetical protein